MTEGDRPSLRIRPPMFMPCTQWPILLHAAKMDLPWTDEDEAIWRQLERAHPHLFDGPAVCCIADSAGEITLFQASYRYVAVQQARASQGFIGSRAPRLVGVKGIILLPADDDRSALAPSGRRLVVGLRRHAHRMYPLMWESVPAGGLDRLVPSPDAAADGPSSAIAGLLRQLRVEAREELGLHLPDHQPASLLGLLIDNAACSLDFVLQIDGDRAMADMLKAQTEASSASPFREHAAIDVIDQQTLDTWLGEAASIAISPALRAIAGAIRWSSFED